MDEQTGTEEVLFDPSDFDVQEAEQSENNDSPAVEATNEEQTASEEQDAVVESEVSTEENKEETQTDGDAIDEFLAKKGIDSNDPQAMRKVVEMYRNAEKGFYQKSQEKAKLERELANAQPAQSTPDQQALSEVRALKTQMDVEKWKQEKKLTPETEQKMMDWFNQPIVNNGQQVLDASGNPIIRGYLFTNGLISLDDVYNFVGGNVNTELENKKQNLTEELRQEVKKEMSARQAAKSTKQGTTDSTQFDKPAETDSFLEGLGF